MVVELPLICIGPGKDDTRPGNADCEPRSVPDVPVAPKDEGVMPRLLCILLLVCGPAGVRVLVPEPEPEVVGFVMMLPDQLERTILSKSNQFPLLSTFVIVSSCWSFESPLA